MDGQNAVITIAQEFIYPVDYEAATISGTAYGGDDEGGGGTSVIAIAPEPTFETVAPDDEQ